jgi:hypothetical protein
MNIIGQGGKIMLFTLPSLVAAIGKKRFLVYDCLVRIKREKLVGFLVANKSNQTNGRNNQNPDGKRLWIHFPRR